MKKLIILLSSILLLGCTQNRVRTDLDKPFIKSYKELSEDCSDSLIEILKPLKLEDEKAKISHIYQLDVKLDSTLYSKEELRYNYFIGITFEPDSYSLLVLDINLNLGAITNCEALDNKKLIIKNLKWFFTDLSSLGDLGCLNIDKSLTAHTRGNKPRFREVAWTSAMYGVWNPSSGKRKFMNSIYNNSWVFKPDDIFMLIRNNSDTLLTDKIELQGETLRMVNSGDTFEIATQTNTKMLLREKGASDFVTLVKQKR